MGTITLLGILFLSTILAQDATANSNETVVIYPTSVEPEVTSAKPVTKSAKVRDVRLPRHLEPLHYNLELVPFLIPDNFTIRGRVEIEVLCRLPATNITLHAADLEIENSTVTVTDLSTGDDIKVSGVAYDEAREFFILNTGSELEKGKKYVIKIQYTAFLKDNLKGFYRSVYVDAETNTTEYIAVTQFQAADARRAFPCFDEPALKASYKVKLGRTKDRSSISNMPIEEKGVTMDGSNDYVWDVYQKSVKMSTYLVAFVVSKFEYIEAEKLENDVRFRIWSLPSAQDQTAYAQKIGPAVLQHFEEFFNVSFPLPKQDMIAIPDFGAGAMENWGLITYRETALLFKEGVSSAKNMERIAYVISHELAHQWFGNLVTPSWWTDLWLNEGFATYVGYLGVDAVQPELQIMEEFMISEFHDVLRLDVLESSHPVSVPVGHPDEIGEIFDKISYGKGASIIRMMEHFLTKQTFRRGLANYLNELKYKAAEQDDLWEHLTEQGHKDGTLGSDMDVKTVMDTWTLQSGFPVVTVTRNYEENTANIEQNKFRVGEKGEKEDDAEWWVPLTFTEPGTDAFNETSAKLWLKPGGGGVETVISADSNTPVIFNVQQNGYYRVNYDKKNWALIAEQLNKDHTSIHVINRAQILDDAFNLAKAGQLDYDTVLGLTSYLAKETEYIPWAAALSGLSYISRMLKRSPAYGDFKRYTLGLVTGLYTRLGSVPQATDTHMDTKLRSKAISWACSMGHKGCKEDAVESWSEWMNNPEDGNPIDANLKGVTYCNAIAEGGEKEWQFGWSQYQASDVASEKVSLLYALTCAEEVWLLNRFLNMSIHPETGVRTQDSYKVIGGIGGETVGRYLAWDFVRNRWPELSKLYTGFAASYVGRIIKSITSSFNTEFDLEQLRDFGSENKADLTANNRAMAQATEAVENNVKWMEENYSVVANWLNNQVY